MKNRNWFLASANGRKEERGGEERRRFKSLAGVQYFVRFVLSTVKRNVKRMIYE